jgi:hypothetical protein
MQIFGEISYLPYSQASVAAAKSFQCGAGLLSNHVYLSSALTYYGKDSRIAFSSRKRSFFVPIVTVIDEICEKSLLKSRPTFINY